MLKISTQKEKLNIFSLNDLCKTDLQIVPKEFFQALKHHVKEKRSSIIEASTYLESEHFRFDLQNNFFIWKAKKKSKLSQKNEERIRVAEVKKSLGAGNFGAIKSLDRCYGGVKNGIFFQKELDRNLGLKVVSENHNNPRLGCWLLKREKKIRKIFPRYETFKKFKNFSSGPPAYMPIRILGKKNLFYLLSHMNEIDKFSEKISFILWISFGLLEQIILLDKAKIVHNDIKEDNFVISPFNSIRLVDFGASQLVASLDAEAIWNLAGNNLYPLPETQGSQFNIDNKFVSLKANIYQACKIIEKQINKFGLKVFPDLAQMTPLNREIENFCDSFIQGISSLPQERPFSQQLLGATLNLAAAHILNELTEISRAEELENFLNTELFPIISSLRSKNIYLLHDRVIDQANDWKYKQYDPKDFNRTLEKLIEIAKNRELSEKIEKEILSVQKSYSEINRSVRRKNPFRKISKIRRALKLKQLWSQCHSFSESIQAQIDNKNQEILSLVKDHNFLCKKMNERMDKEIPKLKNIKKPELRECYKWFILGVVYIFLNLITYYEKFLFLEELISVFPEVKIILLIILVLVAIKAFYHFYNFRKIRRYLRKNALDKSSAENHHSNDPQFSNLEENSIFSQQQEALPAQKNLYEI